MTSHSVTADLHYSVDNGRPIDYYFYEPDPGTVLNSPGTDVQAMTIHDAWPLRRRLSLDTQGFIVTDFPTSFSDFDDDAAIKERFYREIVALVKAKTGARRVEVFDHTIRRRMPPDLAGQTEVQRPAVQLVHSDYTPKSGPQRVRDLIGGDEAETLLAGRVAFYNVWKPLYETVRELPLALCDATSASADDMLIMELKYRERTGEIFVMRHSPDHRWHYFPQMTPEQALLLKTYDSETDGRARFMGHSAFEDPTTPPDAPKRQSIEIRTMAFF
ncbi:MAG: CmcJ/NvfI family oxidoreductase [Rhodospirillales bacterium]